MMYKHDVCMFVCRNVEITNITGTSTERLQNIQKMNFIKNSTPTSFFQEAFGELDAAMLQLAPRKLLFQNYIWQQVFLAPRKFFFTKSIWQQTMRDIFCVFESFHVLGPWRFLNIF